MCRVAHQDNPVGNPIVRGHFFDGSEMDRPAHGCPNQVDDRVGEIAEHILETARVPPGRVLAVFTRLVEVAVDTVSAEGYRQECPGAPEHDGPVG